MERQRYLEWKVTASDAIKSPLGYVVSLSDDRYSSQILSKENSFDRPDLFLLNDGSFPIGGIISPHAGDTISYRLSSSLARSTPLIVNNQSIYRGNANGEIIGSKDVGQRIRFLAIDQSNNNSWISLNSGEVLTLSSNQVMSSIVSPIDVVAAIPDGARSAYWLIRKNLIDLNSIQDGKLASVNTPDVITSVRSAEVNPSTGDLFVITDRFLMTADVNGTADYHLVSWADLTLFGNGSVLGVAYSDKIYRYNGTAISTVATLGGGEELTSISGLKYGLMYAYDAANNKVICMNSSYAVLWRETAFSSPQENVRLRVSLTSPADNRRIYCWSEDVLLAIEDSGSPRQLKETIIGSGEHGCKGGLLSCLPPSHAWATTIACTEAP